MAPSLAALTCTAALALCAVPVLGFHAPLPAARARLAITRRSGFARRSESSDASPGVKTRLGRVAGIAGVAVGAPGRALAVISPLDVALDRPIAGLVARAAASRAPLLRLPLPPLLPSAAALAVALAVAAGYRLLGGGGAGGGGDDAYLDEYALEEPLPDTTTIGGLQRALEGEGGAAAGGPRGASASASASAAGDLVAPGPAPTAAPALPRSAAARVADLLPPALSRRLRMGFGTAAALQESAYLAYRNQFPPAERDVLDPGEWVAAALVGKAAVGSSSVRYRFSLAGSRQLLALELGQELSMIGLDKNQRVTRGAFVPASSRRKRGRFDVVVPTPTAPSTAAAAAVADPTAQARHARPEMEESFAQMIAGMSVGEQVAVKPGRTFLEYDGPDVPLKRLTCIVAELGVVPAMQLAAELLPAGASSVEAADIVWVNEDEMDFAYYDELEALFYKHHRKLEVSCVLEDDLYYEPQGVKPPLFDRNEALSEAVRPYEEGTLCLVAGPEAFRTKVREHLVEVLNYPTDVIVSA